MGGERERERERERKRERERGRGRRGGRRYFIVLQAKSVGCAKPPVNPACEKSSSNCRCKFRNDKV